MQQSGDRTPASFARAIPRCARSVSVSAGRVHPGCAPQMPLPGVQGESLSSPSHCYPASYGQRLAVPLSRRRVLSAVRKFSRQEFRSGRELLLTRAVLATHVPADGECALSSSQTACQSFGQVVPNDLTEF